MLVLQESPAKTFQTTAQLACAVQTRIQSQMLRASQEYTAPLAGRLATVTF